MSDDIEKSEKAEDSKENDSCPEPENKLIPMPPGLEEAIGSLPARDQKILRSSFSSMYRFSAGPMMNPLVSKMKDGHIDKIIDYTENGEIREHQEGKDIRRMTLIIFFSVLIFVTGLTVFFTLQNKAEFITPFMTGLLGLIGGFGGGYGIGKYKK